MARALAILLLKRFTRRVPLNARLETETFPARGPRRPTVRDVARAAGVSPATVSNVLTGRRNVDPAIRARVTDAVAALGYRPDRVASILRSAARSVVGAVVPELTNPFFAGLVERLEREAHAAGKRLLVAASGGDPAEEEREVAALVAWRPAGVLVVPCDARFAARAVLERDGVPFVVVDRPLLEGAPVDTVAVDNEAAAREGARRVIEVGHRRVLVVASSLAVSNMRERVAGVRSIAAGLKGIELREVEAGFAVDEAARLVAAELARRPPPTAVFALNNILTLGTLKALGQLGLELPKDLSLLGFDDYDWMEVFRPPLSAVRQPVAELAQTAWQLLARRLAAGAVDPRHVRLPCELAWRGSVAPPPDARTGTPSPRRTAAANPGSAPT